MVEHENILKFKYQGAGVRPQSPLPATCPACELQVVFQPTPQPVSDLIFAGGWLVGHRVCPSPTCGVYVFIVVLNGSLVFTYPPLIRSARPPLSTEVPEALRKDFADAASVLGSSGKASAALSRRLLQRFLHEHFGVERKNLADEIQAILDGGKVPPYLSEALDAVRNIGNFAAHPMKSQQTGVIVEVEPGEAEWLLDVLEMLFDFHFVRTADASARKTALNKKLQELGKPPMK